MHITIIRQDRTVGIDGEFYRIKEVQELPRNFWALQWNGTSGTIEWTDKPSTNITSLSEYQFILQAWQQAKDKFSMRS